MTEYVAIETLPALQEKKWILACRADEIPEDEGLQVMTIPPVSVFAVDGEYFCIDDTCTHETVSLADGWVEDCIVECTLHFAKFDLRTGKVVSPPASEPVAVHPIAVIDGEVYVAVPSNYLVKER